MKNPTERQFYERLNEIDSEDTGNWLGMAIIFAISGFTVGFIAGYFVERLLGSL